MEKEIEKLQKEIEQLKKELQSRPTKEEINKMIETYVFNNVPLI